MPNRINDSEYPTPSYVSFSDLAVREFARKDGNLIRKINGSQAFDETNCAVVSMGGTDQVQAVDVELRELAPGSLA